MIIDYIDNLHLPDDQAGKYGNELHSLNYLAQGLGYLYTQVKEAERTVLARMAPNTEVFMGGNNPELKGIPQGLVACAFHWYAVSICNYVRLVGWLAYGEDRTKATEYIKRVVPAVYVWRNKVAAHFAITDPKKQDTPSDLAKSVMFPISFENDAFFAGSLILSMGRPGKASTSRRDMRWSLTHTHEDCLRRFRPNPIKPG